MSWEATKKLTERFNVVRDELHALFPRWRVGSSYTGWSEALQAYSSEVLAAVTRRFRRLMEQTARTYWLREGWLAFAADGTRVECPRTEANEQGLGCAGKDRTSPQLMLTTLYHMGTGLPWAFRVGPGKESERRQLEQLIEEIPSGALLVTDAGFASYELCSALIHGGRHFLLRVGSNIQLLTELGWSWEIRGQTVYLWPEKYQHQDAPPLVLRLIVLGQDEPRVYLITDVLDVGLLSQEQASVLFTMRWGVEVFYRSYKQTMEHHTMLSRTPSTCREELTWTMIGLWLMGLSSVRAILSCGGDPLAWSVAKSRDCLRRALRGALTHKRAKIALRAQLAQAVKDTYLRPGPKKARNWPHKKREKPPGPPKIRPADAKEVQRAKRLKTTNIAA
jgi:hypothetical protein